MKEITREDVLKLCEKWQKELKVNVKRVQIREMKNKWGSYSSNGVLTLNKELLRFPLDTENAKFKLQILEEIIEICGRI